MEPETPLEALAKMALATPGMLATERALGRVTAFREAVEVLESNGMKSAAAIVRPLWHSALEAADQAVAAQNVPTGASR